MFQFKDNLSNHHIFFSFKLNQTSLTSQQDCAIILACVHTFPRRLTWIVCCCCQKPHSERKTIVRPLNHHYSPIIVIRVEHTQSAMDVLRINKKPKKRSWNNPGREIIDNQFHASTATNFHTSLSMSLMLRDNFFLSLAFIAAAVAAAVDSWRQ